MNIYLYLYLVNIHTAGEQYIVWVRLNSSIQVCLPNLKANIHFRAVKRIHNIYTHTQKHTHTPIIDWGHMEEAKSQVMIKFLAGRISYLGIYSICVLGRLVCFQFVSKLENISPRCVYAALHKGACLLFYFFFGFRFRPSCACHYYYDYYYGNYYYYYKAKQVFQ